MSTIKSSAENLTLNADGANNDVIIQSNGSTKVTVDGQNSRVGIGTATPAHTLDISGGSVVIEDGYGYGFGDNSYRIEGKDDGATTARIGFVTGGSEIARFTADGLTFNADTAAANALDDYETGTCTIQYSDGTTTVGSANTGQYTKVGRLVTVTGYINVVNIGSLTGSQQIRIAGFPFTNTGDVTFPYFSRFINAPTNTINTVGYFSGNKTYANFYFMVDAAAYQVVTVGDVSNNNDLYFGVTYTAT